MSDTMEAFDLEAANEAGFFGTRVDPTPNHAYTVEGVGAGEATPETDDGAKEAATARIAELKAAADPASQTQASSSRTTKASSAS